MTILAFMASPDVVLHHRPGRDARGRDGRAIGARNPAPAARRFERYVSTTSQYQGSDDDTPGFFDIDGAKFAAGDTAFQDTLDQCLTTLHHFFVIEAGDFREIATQTGREKYTGVVRGR